MTIHKRGIYDVEGELEKLGYDFDALIDELVYQISNLGVQWEYNDEAYRGFIVGERSFGKGLVQEEIILQDGSLIRLTVSRYYTPSGRCIQKPFRKDEIDKDIEQLEKQAMTKRK